MASIVYPVILPAPLLDGLSRASSSSAKKEGPSKGPLVPFKWSDDGSDVWTLTWRFTPSQKRIFDDWWFNDLSNGSLWFDIGLPVGVDLKGQLRTQEANFNRETPETSYQGAFNRVTATLSVRDVYRDTVAFTDSLLDVVATGDDAIAVINQLEKLVNVELGGIA